MKPNVDKIKALMAVRRWSASELARQMASHEQLLASALNLDIRRMNRYCKTVNPTFLAKLNKQKPTTMSQLADIWYGTQDADYCASYHSRKERRFIVSVFRR